MTADKRVQNASDDVAGNIWQALPVRAFSASRSRRSAGQPYTAGRATRGLGGEASRGSKLGWRDGWGAWLRSLK